MPDEIYEVVSQAARYWFLFLMALIVWRSFRWLRRDRRQRRKHMRLLPDAGYVGELVVLQGNNELPEGLALPVSGEGVLGSLRSDDVYVPVRGVAHKHLWYEFDEENGLRLQPYRHRSFQVDEETCEGQRWHLFMTHGARLTVGDAVLRLRLFAGFEYAGVRYAPVAEQEEVVQQPLAAAMQPNAPPSAGVTFTPEQVAVIQQMQWAAWQAQQAQMQTGTMQTADGEFAPPQVLGYQKQIAAEENDEAYGEAYEDVLPPQAVEPARASARLRRAPLPPLAADAPGADRRADARAVPDMPEYEPPYPEAETYDAQEPFYPPVLNESTEETWPYAPDPLNVERFESDGYPNPAYLAPEKADEYAGQGEAPRTLYVEPDEAEKAKRLLWDKYLKGGRRP
jgi:hypothetical protein